MGRDGGLHVVEGVYLAAVERLHDVADLEPGGGGRAIGLDLVDPGRGRGLAEKGEQAGENHDPQEEIGDRAGGDDGRAWTHLLVVEAPLALLVRHIGEGIGRRGRGFGVVAEKLHIAAERYGRDLPAGAMAVVETNQLWPEAERKGQNLHAGPAGAPQMAQLG